MQAVITSGHDVAIHIEEVPDHEMTHLARATLRAVEQFFKIPGVQEDYEKWLVEYKQRKEAAI